MMDALERGDLDGARAAAVHIVRRTYRTQRQAGVPLECRGVIAEYDPLDETLTVWSSTQIPHLLRTYLSEELEWPETRLRVLAPEVGGGFGSTLMTGAGRQLGGEVERTFGPRGVTVRIVFPPHPKDGAA